MFKEVVIGCFALAEDSLSWNNKAQLFSAKLVLNNVMKKSQVSFEG
jgi:hypothetical protein